MAAIEGNAVEWNNFALERLNKLLDLDIKSNFVLSRGFNINYCKHIIKCLVANGFFEDFKTFSYHTLVENNITAQLEYYEGRGEVPEWLRSSLEEKERDYRRLRTISPDELFQQMEQNQGNINMWNESFISKLLLGYIYIGPNRRNPAVRQCFQALADEYYSSKLYKNF